MHRSIVEVKYDPSPSLFFNLQGMYPASHGIIANKFYDPSFDAEFRVGREEFFKKRWWGGEPLWSTVQRQVRQRITLKYSLTF